MKYATKTNIIFQTDTERNSGKNPRNSICEDQSLNLLQLTMRHFLQMQSCGKITAYSGILLFQGITPPYSKLSFTCWLCSTASLEESRAIY